MVKGSARSCTDTHTKTPPQSSSACAASMKKSSPKYPNWFSNTSAQNNGAPKYGCWSWARSISHVYLPNVTNVTSNLVWMHTVKTWAYQLNQSWTVSWSRSTAEWEDSWPPSWLPGSRKHTSWWVSTRSSILTGTYYEKLKHVVFVFGAWEHMFGCQRSVPTQKNVETLLLLLLFRLFFF